MGINQRKENDAQSELSQESSLDKLVPPTPLPTLSTLSNPAPDAPEIDLSRLSDNPSEPEAQPNDVDTMGAGLSKGDEVFIVEFLKGCYEEFKIIDWPSPERVVKITLLILVTLFTAIVSLYFIDGFFYRMSQVYFEGV